MVYVQQDGVEFARRGGCIEACACEFEKIALPQLASGVVGKHISIRYEAGLVPVDHYLEEIDDEQPVHHLVFQGLDGRIAEPQTTDHDIQLTLERRQAQLCELAFALGKKAGHQVFVAELDLEHLAAAQKRFHPSAKRQLAKRRILKVEFLDVHQFN